MSKNLNLYCFQPEYEKEFVAIKASEAGKTFAFCKVCLTDFMISRSGKADIYKHLRSKDHASNGKKLFENFDHPDADVIRAEYLYADACNRHKIPLSSEDDVGMVFQRMFPDSDIAKKFNLKRIRTSAILDEIAFKQLSNNLNITCNCGRQAIINTVRKENHNKGRQFYACPELNQETRCNFFLWKDDEASASNAQTPHASSFSPNNSFNARQSNGALQPNGRNSNDGNTPMCRCPDVAVQRRVTKDNENKGRTFYVCSKQGEESCKFFQWADEDGSSTSSVDPLPSTSFAVPSTSNSRRKHPGNASGPPAKRKCGICSQTGHNRKNCPSNR